MNKKHLIAILGMAVLLGVGALLIFPSSPEEKCAENLLQIEGEMVGVGLENRLTDGQSLPAGKVVSFLRGGQLPNCPSGGSYTIPAVGQLPTCSVHGDLIAKYHPRERGKNEAN